MVEFRLAGRYCVLSGPWARQESHVSYSEDSDGNLTGFVCWTWYSSRMIHVVDKEGRTNTGKPAGASGRISADGAKTVGVQVYGIIDFILARTSCRANFYSTTTLI